MPRAVRVCRSDQNDPNRSYGVQNSCLQFWSFGPPQKPRTATGCAIVQAAVLPIPRLGHMRRRYDSFLGGLYW
jgi:hypothetical protein